jgi:hypothetical protein
MVSYHLGLNKRPSHHFGLKKLSDHHLEPKKLPDKHVGLKKRTDHHLGLEKRSDYHLGLKKRPHQFTLRLVIPIIPQSGRICISDIILKYKPNPIFKSSGWLNAASSIAQS